MSNDLLVIMGATTEGGTMRKYIEQLTAAGIDHHVDWRDEYPNMNGGGTLAYKMKTMREGATRFSHYKKLVFSCAFDVTFYGAKEDALRNIPNEGVLIAAEKNCYPDQSLASFITGETSSRYYNGGLLAGTPASFLKWIDAVECHPMYASRSEGLDQTFFNILLAADSNHPLVKVDARGKLFFCLFGGYDELEFENGIPVNKITSEHPCFVHANGKWPSEEMFARYERSLA